jgi:hypothetical protein
VEEVGRANPSIAGFQAAVEPCGAMVVAVATATSTHSEVEALAAAGAEYPWMEWIGRAELNFPESLSFSALQSPQGRMW